MIEIYFRIKDTNGALVDLLAARTDVITSFFYENEVNKRLSGKFSMVDERHLISRKLNLQSGFQGRIVFLNAVSDLNDIRFSEQDNSEVSIIITNWQTTRINQTNSVIEFDFIGGTHSEETVQTALYKGNSVSAMSQVFKNRNSEYVLGSEIISLITGSDVDPLSTIDNPGDNGGWYAFKDDMFDSLNYIVNHSMKFNDYLYWVYDDINSMYKISSIGEFFEIDDRFVFYHNNTSYENNIYATDSNYKVIFPDGVKLSSEFGMHRDKIFPGNSYSYGYGNKIESSHVDFREYLRSMDNENLSVNGQELFDTSEINNIDQPTYGKTSIRQMYSLNTHKLHAFAEDYRNFKMSLFSKTVTISSSNSFLVPLGEYVSFLIYSPHDYEDSYMELDRRYSDRYFVKKRVVYYDTDLSSIVTSLTLVSDNTNESGETMVDFHSKVVRDLKRLINGQ